MKNEELKLYNLHQNVAISNFERISKRIFWLKVSLFGGDDGIFLTEKLETCLMIPNSLLNLPTFFFFSFSFFLFLTSIVYVPW